MVKLSPFFSESWDRSATREHDPQISIFLGNLSSLESEPFISLMDKYNSDAVRRRRKSGGRNPPAFVAVWFPELPVGGIFQCASCCYQFSVTAGTIMHDSHLPLRKWFLAVYLMCESRKGMSANQLHRTLGVSYKTAWYL